MFIYCVFMFCLFYAFFCAKNQLPYFFPNYKGFSMHLQFGCKLEQNLLIKVINQQQQINILAVFKFCSNWNNLSNYNQSLKTIWCVGYSAKNSVVFLSSKIVKWFLFDNSYPAYSNTKHQSWFLFLSTNSKLLWMLRKLFFVVIATYSA